MRRSTFLVAAGLALLSAAAPARAALQLDLRLTGLTTLVDVTHAPGDAGRLFLVRQQGQILVWNGSSAPTVFLDIAPLMGSGFEGGMKSIAFPPDYATTGFFFVHYTNTSSDSVLARYSRLTADTADPASGVILLTVDQQQNVHQGGQLGFDSEGMLLMALGDGGPQTDPSCHAQRPDTYQGKLLRFDIHQNVATPPYYGIPADNPFVGPGGFADEVWAYGFRNPWRFSFDRHSGSLYIADVGQSNREEIDVEPKNFAGGRNYGWRVMEGSFCHDPDPVDADCPAGTPSCGSPLYTPPAFEYDHSGGECSITGGFVYRGPEHASLLGHYLYGDWCTGRIWANSPQEAWTPEALPFTLGGITTFGEDARGNLYLSEGANLYRLSDPNAVFVDGFESGTTAAWLP